MALTEYKITSTDLVGKGVSTLSGTKYTGEADMLKARFDSLFLDVLKPKYNDLIDFLGGSDGFLPKSGGTLSGNVAAHHLAPCADDTYTLGYANKKWSVLYVNTITGHEVTGNVTSRDVMPATHETYKLGASDNYWQYGYIKTLYTATITGHEVAGNLLPKAANSYDLGASTAIWKNIYANTLTANGNITVNNNGGVQKSCFDINNGLARWYVNNGTNSFIGLELRVSDGVVYSPAIYGLTTTSGANIYITSGAQLCRSTSSRRFKDNIKPADMAEILGCLRALEVKNYTSKCEHDDKNKVHTGGIAEQFRAVDARLAVINEENPELTDAIDTNEVLYRLLAGWQWCDSEMETIKTRITALEAKGA